MFKTLVRSTSGIRPIGECQQSPREYTDSSSLDGVAAQVKLLLKIIQDHKDATKNNRNDGRKRLRVATMLTILENIRLRIQRCQFKPKTTETDMRPSSSSNSDGQQQRYTGEDEKEMLRKNLHAISEERKSLELSCTNLVEEKKIMTIELTRTTHLIKETEVRINDLKTHNQLLANKVKKCKCEHRNKKVYGSNGSSSTAAALKERQEKTILLENNKKLSDNFVATLNKCRSMEMKEKQLQQKNAIIRAEMEVITGEVKAGLAKFNQLKENMASRTDAPANIREEITRLEHVFERFQKMILN